MPVQELTVREAATILGCNRSTVQRMAKDGRLRGRRIAGRWWLLDPHSVLNMAGQNRKTPRAYRKKPRRGSDTTATREATASCLQ